MTKKRLAVDFDLASQKLELLLLATQGASRVHITWSGVDLARPNSSLLNITFYDNTGIMKVCGGKPQIQFCIPKSLKHALGTQVLTADYISVIFNKIKRNVRYASD